MLVRDDFEEYRELLGFSPQPWGSTVAESQVAAVSIPTISASDEGIEWGALEAKAKACLKCPLAQTRNSVVFESGDRQARLMFVGEGPGADEDEQALPFVGKAGQLLTKMIEAMGLSREQVYIANVVKCRPPQNRNPDPLEIDSCSEYLRAQVQLVKPELIVALGSVAAKALLVTEEPISKLRGQIIESEKYLGDQVLKILPTFHPAFLLRNPDMKKVVWEDLQKAMALLGLKRKES